MLICTDASITDIALSVGFNDLSNFTRKFHQFYACSPGAYRRNKKLTRA
jgi:AraC-like DNA-binding protein